MAAQTKDEWRRRARRAKDSLALDDPRHLGGIVEFLERTSRTADWMLGYHAIAGQEVDLAPLFERSDLGPFAVTRTPDPSEADPTALTVHPIGGPEERHRYGFAQPAAGSPTVPDREVGIVLVPGLAFDRTGGRLGRGRGYYDRLLTRFGPQTLRIGITGGSVVAELPVEEHDVVMTHLSGAFGVLPVPLQDPEG